jgi:uncharacterized protein YhjY with autotransporter beta-barrel domain
MRPYYLFFILFTLKAIAGSAQLSMGINISAVSVINAEQDDYALTTQWPELNSTGSDNISFFKDGKGTAFHAFVGWELSSRLALTMNYRSINLQIEESKRNASISTIGIGMRYNLRSSEEKVIPYLQAEYKFIHNTQLRQEQATYNSQTQPEIDEKLKGSIAIGIDAGAEIALARALYLNFQVGFHGGKWASTDDETRIIEDHPYQGNNIRQPSGVDNGYSALLFTGGFKYYFSKRSKKRDF